MIVIYIIIGGMCLWYLWKAWKDDEEERKRRLDKLLRDQADDYVNYLLNDREDEKVKERIQEHLGELFYRKRVDLNLGMREVAEANGVDITVISDMGIGKIKPNFDYLRKALQKRNQK